MPGADAFSTLAEVAVAFLGFTGVVGIFGPRGQPGAVVLRLWVMVEFGLALLLLALLPTTLHNLGWSGAPLWASCSVATLLFLLGHVIFVVPPIARHVRSGSWGAVPAALNVVFPLVFSLCFVTQLLNASNVLLGRSHGGYLLGLFLLVAASGFNFSALLVALRGSGASTTSPQ